MIDSLLRVFVRLVLTIMVRVDLLCLNSLGCRQKSCADGACVCADRHNLSDDYESP